MLFSRPFRPSPGSCSSSAGPAFRPFALAAGLLLVALHAHPAAAECEPDGADPTLIVCTGTDADGFDAGMTNDLTVRVDPGARVENGGVDGFPAITVNDDSRVTVDETATIDATGILAGGIVAGDGAQVELNGILGVTGDDGTGIAIGGNGTAGVSPTGSLLMTGDDAVGIEVGTDSLVGNGGRIEIRGVDGIGIRSLAGGGAIFNTETGVIEILEDGGVGILAGADAGTVQNDGLIRVDGASVVGIRTTNGDGEAMTPEVVNNGTIEATGNSAIGIDAGPDSVIQNLGTVSGGFGFASAIRFTSGENRLQNLSTGVVDGGIGGVAVLGGTGSDAVENSGRIEGDVLLRGGDDSFATTPSGVVSGLLDGGAGDDEIRLTGGGDGSLDLDTVTGFETLRLDSTATQRWNISGSGAFPGTGVEVIRGIFAPDGVVAITGDYLQGADSFFEVSLDADGTGDRLDLDGTFTIEPGARLLVAGTGVIGSSVTWTILTATGGVVGEFDPLSGSGFFDVGLFYQPDEIELRVRRISYTVAARTSNQFDTATYLDQVVAGGVEGDMADVIEQLDGFTFDEFDDAADELHPEFYDAQTDASLLHGRIFTDVLREERPGCAVREYHVFEETRSTLAPCSKRGWVPWARAIGATEDRDGSNGHTRYDINAVGLAAGADWRRGEQWTASGGLAVIRSGIDFRGAGNGSLVSLELGARAAYRHRWLRAGAGLAYAHGWHEIRRQLDTLQRRATADFDGDRVSLFGDLGAPIPVGPVVIEPGVRLDYVWVSEEDVDESGASSVNLEVDGREESIFSTSPGITIRNEFLKREFWTTWTEWMDGTWRSEAHVRYRRTWVGADRNIQASFEGAPSGTGSFGVDANQPDGGVEFGARVTFQPLESKATVGLSYDAFTGDDTWIHRGTLDVRIPFD